MIIKIIAMLSMFIDHYGLILRPEDAEIYRMLGRFAFPIFGYLIVRNYLFFTSNQKAYRDRLMFWGVITTFYFMYVFGIMVMNVLLGFFIFLFAISMKNRYLGVLLILAAGTATQYHYEGYLYLAAIYYFLKGNKSQNQTLLAIALVLFTSYILNFYLHPEVSLLAGFMVIIYHYYFAKYEQKPNKLFARLAYPFIPFHVWCILMLQGGV